MNNFSKKLPASKKSVTFSDLKLGDTGGKEVHKNQDYSSRKDERRAREKYDEKSVAYACDNDDYMGQETRLHNYEHSKPYHQPRDELQQPSKIPPSSRRGPLTVELLQKSYPSHGIIKSSAPGWLDLNWLHPPSRGDEPSKKSHSADFRLRKFNLEEYSSGNLDEEFPSCNSALCRRPSHHSGTTPTPASGGGRMDFNNGGKRTCDLYTVDPGLPHRFNNPSWFQGYGCDKNCHPFYRTTSGEYGLYPPNVHTMPQTYHPVKNIFSEHLKASGMPRNRSLNIN